TVRVRDRLGRWIKAQDVVDVRRGCRVVAQQKVDVTRAGREERVPVALEPKLSAGREPLGLHVQALGVTASLPQKMRDVRVGTHDVIACTELTGNCQCE